MVLKRIFAMTLGALGLGALAAGTAFGQQAPGAGNIPAPDLFDDQIACTQNLPAAMSRPMPSVVPMGEDDSPLDTIIGMGDRALDATGLSGVTVGTQSGVEVVMDLGYVVPPMGSNCGQSDATVTDFFMGAQDDSIPMDVAEGYSLLLAEFVDVYGDPGDATTGAAGALAMARMALAMADADDADYEDLQDAVDDALEEYNKQKAEFDALAAGPINQAGVAEWMAKSDVTNAIAAYNTAVGMVSTTETSLGELDYVSIAIADDGVQTRTSKYIPLAGTELATIAADGFTVTELRNYANADGDQVASVDSETGEVTYTGESNFDSGGNLLIPTVEDTNDRDGDGATDDYVPALSTDNGVDLIRARVESYNDAAAALKKARDENGNTLLQTLYDVAYERAQAEADYYNEIWSDVRSDSTDHRTQTEREAGVDNEDDPVDAYSIASRYSAFVKASNTREEAELDLRNKVKVREDATEAVVDAFQNPGTFYDQLVARRQAKKFAADKAVADADNPGKSLTDAAAAAQKALTEAEEAQADYQALYADASDPVQELIDELLMTDGDDGQALVDAISGSYDTANSAKETADQVAEDIAGLTGAEGAVSRNTAAISDNADDITALDGRVAMNEGEIWDADGNSRIDANETRSMENRTMIGENRDMIATNAGNIATNTTMIGENRGMIETNASGILTNAGHITENRGMIETNASGISSNADAIAANMNSIGSNTSSISDNRNMIGELSDDLDVVRAGVAASMALAGMPAINGRGISIGVGSFDGESAFAVGFQIQGEMASFKVGVTSASGATGASAGVGFQF